MSLTNPNTPVSQQDLQDFYHKIVPYMGGMPEVLANKFSKGDMYSTDEKMIGQWVDDKPLYSKTINFGALPNNTSKSVAHGISNLDFVVDYSAIAKSTDTIFKPIPLVYQGSDTATKSNTSIQFDSTEIKMTTNNDRSTYTVCYITMKYTKTTDSAISIGDDTDYSTEEKMVGTWIDGRPLWQKTIDCGVLPNATSSKLIAHGISNFYMPVQVFGIAHRTNGASILLPCVRAKGVTTTTDVAVSQFVSIDIDATDITITTGYDWSAITDKSYVTLQYIKTT